MYSSLSTTRGDRYYRLFRISFLVILAILVVIGFLSILDISLFNKINKKGKENQAYRYKEYGYEDLSQGKFTLAAANFQKSLGIDSTYGDAMIGLGQAYFAMGNKSRAHDIFTLALKHDPIMPNVAYRNLGRIYQERDDIIEAKRSYKKAITCAADPAKALISLGWLYLKTDNPDSAVIYFSRAEKSYTSMETRYRAMLTKELEFYRDNREIFIHIQSDIQREFSDLELDLFDNLSFKQSLKNDKTLASIYHLLGVSQAEIGQLDSGIENIRKAISINPNNDLFKSDLQVALDRLDKQK